MHQSAECDARVFRVRCTKCQSAVYEAVECTLQSRRVRCSQISILANFTMCQTIENENFQNVVIICEMPVILSKTQKNLDGR